MSEPHSVENMMKLFIFALTMSCSSALASAETGKPNEPALPFDSEISSELLLAMEASSFAPEVSANGNKTWEFASLSCIAAHFVDPEGSNSLMKKECTLENAAGLELAISEVLSAQLIEKLEAFGVKPLSISTDEFKFYSLKDFRCETFQAEPSSEKQLDQDSAGVCSVSNVSANPFGA